MNDPASPIAAANGQYLLISREAYDAVGGHAKIANDLLEDVAMARLVKSSGHKIFFRYGGDAVRTRMYRSFAQMKEGWTKNLVLLFAPVSSVACLRLSEFLFIVVMLATSALFFLLRSPRVGVLAGLAGVGVDLGACVTPAVLALLMWSIFLIRIRKAHFSTFPTLIAVLGVPVFAYLLVVSARLQRRGEIVWKARNYKSATEAMPRWFQTEGGPFLIVTVLSALMFVTSVVLLTFHRYLFHRH